jgi:hypothetical protein
VSEDTATATFSVVLGLGLRGKWERWIRDYCQYHELDCRMMKSGGWFSSAYHFKISGYRPAVEHLVNWVRAQIEMYDTLTEQVS